MIKNKTSERHIIEVRYICKKHPYNVEIHYFINLSKWPISPAKLWKYPKGSPEDSTILFRNKSLIKNVRRSSKSWISIVLNCSKRLSSPKRRIKCSKKSIQSRERMISYENQFYSRKITKKISFQWFLIFQFIYGYFYDLNYQLFIIFIFGMFQKVLIFFNPIIILLSH